MKAHEPSFWVATAPPYTPNPPLQGDRRADVVVIGGGFSGLSTAFHLRKADAGCEVVVLEGRYVGFGASGRNGGFSMTVFGVSLSVTHMLHGTERTREAYAYMVDAVAYLERLVREHQLDCDFQRSGFLRVATTPGYARRIQAEMNLAQRLGLDGIEWWDRERVQEAVHSPVFLGGWWEPRCALVHPAKLARGLKRLAETAGATVYEHTPVLEVRSVPGGVVVETPQGRVRASKVVFATNAWSHRFPWTRRLQVPAWTYMIATEPLTPDQWQRIGWQQGMGIEDARNLIHYLRPSPDGRLLLGGGPVPLGVGPWMRGDRHAGALAHLQRFLHTLFPQLGPVAVTHHWGGPFSATLDLVPALGYVQDRRAVYNVGCLGHGVSLMPSNGRILADLVLERQTPLTDLWFVNRRVWPWPPEPGRLLLSLLVRGYLQGEDAWHERRGLGPRGA